MQPGPRGGNRKERRETHRMGFASSLPSGLSAFIRVIRGHLFFLVGQDLLRATTGCRRDASGTAGRMPALQLKTAAMPTGEFSVTCVAVRDSSGSGGVPLGGIRDQVRNQRIPRGRLVNRSVIGCSHGHTLTSRVSWGLEIYY